jgi:GPH family glycoside/pentoside/hexuronide:cation symporter
MNDIVNQETIKVPLAKKISWGFGGLADNYIMNSLTVLSMPIYNIAFGMDPVKLGFALFIPRFLDAITDPVMGNISDNTRSRWGRRKPYIVAGSILSALLLPFLWTPPVKTETGMFWYFMILAVIYLTFYTIYVVPYTALGYELTNDYDERTKTLAWRMYIGLIGSLSVPWLYKLCLLSVFNGDAGLGAFWVSVIVAAVIILTGLLPVLFCKEEKILKSEKINFFKSIGYTFKNKPFTILIITYIIIICGLFSSGVLGLYINIYYICNGDKSFAATIGGLAGTLTALISYASLPLATFISLKSGKREAMIIGLVLAFFGYLSMWFTMTPNMPYLQLTSCVIIGLGLQGCWLMVSSMVADICDEDELKTGLRREGIYSAVIGFALKLALSLTSLLGGVLLKISGYNAIEAEKTGSVAPEIILKLKILFIGLQCFALAAASVMFLYYPISRKRANQTRIVLEQRHKYKTS